MTEKIAFDYKRVIKGDVNDHVFDNYGNEYIHFKADSDGILWFKKLEDNGYYAFNKKGEMLNRKEVFLHIENKTDIKKYKYLVRNFSDESVLSELKIENKIFYLKISDNYYFVFRTDSLCVDYRFVMEHENYFKNCHEPDYDEKRVMFNRLYELGYGYNMEKQEVFSNIQLIHEGKYYVYNNTVFKASHDIVYDYRKDVSIPYEYLIDLGSKKQWGTYENATLGLPKYICIREANENEIGEAKEKYESMKINFQNVERKLINIKIDLDKTLQMLYKLKNKNGQQG
jgi:hypothetical protein